MWGAEPSLKWLEVPPGGPRSVWSRSRLEIGTVRLSLGLSMTGPRGWEHDGRDDSAGAEGLCCHSR